MSEHSSYQYYFQKTPRKKTLWNTKRESTKPKSFIPWGIITIFFSILFIIIAGSILGFHIWRFKNDQNQSNYYYAFWIIFFIFDAITFIISLIGFFSGILYRFPKPRVVFAYIVS